MRLALLGYGRMGREVESVAGLRGHEVVCRIDPGVPDLAEGEGGLGGAEVAVVFTTPDGVLESVRAATTAGLDLVVGSTGWSDVSEEVEEMVRAADVGMIHAPNFSLGVHAFLRMVRAAGRAVDGLGEYEVMVRETHHRHKLDRPSGTAIAIAETLVETLGRKRAWAGAEPGAAPNPDVLGVSSVRTGEVAGVHAVVIEGPDDTIELRHVAGRRAAFAKGALAAAEWVQGRRGIFTMEDMMEGGSAS